MTPNTERPPVLIYTDGSCHGNPGPGGWGVHMNNGSAIKELWGSEAQTTNQRMELMAAIKALKSFSTPRRLTVRADSQYLVNGMTKWLPKWIARGWRKSNGQAVDNQALWATLKELAGQHEVTWHWVKGHSGEPGNERADMLANQGCARALAKIQEGRA